MKRSRGSSTRANQALGFVLVLQDRPAAHDACGEGVWVIEADASAEFVLAHHGRCYPPGHRHRPASEAILTRRQV
jgi:hypothetical protein